MVTHKDRLCRYRTIYSLKDNLIALTGKDLYWKIVAFVSDELCGECGSVGTPCDCWMHGSLHSHKSADIWDLNLWCDRCQLSDDTYCVCWRVRRMTRCAACDCRLSKPSRSIDSFTLCMTCLVIMPL